jgi:transcriptional regulator with XRE-family HTH domain
MHYTTLVQVLKTRRETLGITQYHLAELSGVGVRTLKSIETGKGNPTLETMAKLADVLGLEIRLEVKTLNR